MSAKTKWRIELLGGLRIGTGAGWVTQFRTRRAALLMARLALEGAPVRRDVLVEWLWPDSEFEVGRNRLSVALSALRRSLGTPGSKAQLFEGNHDSIGLNLEEVQCDALEFAVLLKRAQSEVSPITRAAQLHEALALWHGPAWNGDGDEWLVEEISSLNAKLCETALSLSELDTSNGLEALQHAHRIEPAREDVVRALMKGLLAIGKVEEAQRIWKGLEKRLRTEQNRVPAAETRALARRIGESHDSHSETVAPERTAIGSTRFFGRQSELEQLGRWLSRGSGAQLITVSGGSGYGKTRLAVEAARRSANAFDQSPCFLSLVDHHDTKRLLEIVGDALHAPRSSSQSALERIAGAIGERRMLLTLDNFEHLASATPDIERLLRRIPSLVCVVTSRCLLDIVGEKELLLSPLPLPTQANQMTDGPPDAVVLEEWAHNPALRLFADRARAVSPTFRLNTGNARAVARLCCILDGVPLALELAAARSLALSPSQIERHLETHLDILEKEGHDVERHRSLRAALDWSYELLSPAGRRVLRRLSIFRGSWTMERAIAICAVSPRDDASVIVRAHEELRRQSLLEGEENGGELRFRFLETVRIYARERAAHDDKRDIQRALEAQHAHEFARFAQNAVRAGRGQKSREWATLLERDLPDLRAAMAWALEHDGGLALRFAASLWWFWFSTSRLGEGRELLQRALQASAEIPDATLMEEGAPSERVNWRAEALSGAGFLAWRQGDLGEAIKLCHRACELGRAAGDMRALTYSLIVLQLAALLRCDFEQVQAMGEECLHLARANADQQAEAFALHLLGGGAEMQGDALTAWKLQEQSAALFEEIGVNEGTAWALFNWGSAARRLGEYQRAVALCAQGREIFQAMASREGTAYCDLYAGLAQLDAGNKVIARQLLQSGLRELFDLGAMWGVAINFEGIARNYFDGTPQKGIEATRLWSAAQMVRAQINAPIPPVDRAQFAAFEAQLKASLPVPSFEAAWETGRSLSLEQCVRTALDA